MAVDRPAGPAPDGRSVSRAGDERAANALRERAAMQTPNALVRGPGLKERAAQASIG